MLAIMLTFDQEPINPETVAHRVVEIVAEQPFTSDFHSAKVLTHKGSFELAVLIGDYGPYIGEAGEYIGGGLLGAMIGLYGERIAEWTLRVKSKLLEKFDGPNHLPDTLANNLEPRDVVQRVGGNETMQEQMRLAGIMILAEKIHGEMKATHGSNVPVVRIEDIPASGFDTFEVSANGEEVLGRINRGRIN